METREIIHNRFHTDIEAYVKRQDGVFEWSVIKCIYNPPKKEVPTYYEPVEEIQKAIEKELKQAKKKKKTQDQPFKKYGLTKQQFDDMVLAQNGLCFLCGHPQKNEKRLAVDHDHKTGRVRGLLCTACNTALGFLKDNPETMLKAAKYVQDLQ